MNVATRNRAQELKIVFDREFAAPLRVRDATERDFIAITIGSGAFALRLGEITGLHVDKKITRLPGHAPALLGVAGFRGAILPVYDLGSLLESPARDASRWLAVVANLDVAIAFESFDGHLRVSSDAVSPNETLEGARKHVRELLHTPQAIRAVINLPSALAQVTGMGP